MNNNISGSSTSQTPNPMYDLAKTRAPGWLEFGIPYSLEKVKSEFVLPTITSDTTKKTMLVALGAILLYGSYQFLVWMGKTKPMTVETKLLMELKSQNTTARQMNAERGVEFEGDLLNNIDNVSFRQTTNLEELKNKIDELRSREDIISWIIKFQQVTINAKNQEAVRGTVGSALVMALRQAMTAVNINLTNDSATQALLETMKELRNKNQLDVLNSGSKEAHQTFQNLETIYHRSHSHQYDGLSKICSGLSIQSRTCLSYYLSILPPSLGRAVLGTSRILSGLANAVMGSCTDG